MDHVPWRDAWHEALYAAERGFYVAAGGPAAHFTTATHGPGGRILAESLLRLWLRDHDHLPSVVVDVGAGRGELATHLRAALDTLAPNAAFGGERAGIQVSSTPTAAFGGEDGGEEGGGDRASGTRVVAVDVVDRPDVLDERIEWLRSPGGAELPEALDSVEDALVVAHEWLDVVPCTIARVAPDGTLREVLVDPATGHESLGGRLAPDDLAWVGTHWPDAEPGDTVEVGRQRDLAWAALVRRIGSGTLVAVDYGHTRATRPRGGSLTAYAAGRRVDPVPDGTRDLTAHVAMDSLEHDELRTQREVLRGLGVLGRTPPISEASADPLGYLAGLERAGAEAQLIDPQGFGGFWWAVRRVDVP